MLNVALVNSNAGSRLQYFAFCCRDTKYHHAMPHASLYRHHALFIGHAAGISKKCIKLRPIAVIKG